MQNKRTIWIMLVAPLILLVFFLVLPRPSKPQPDTHWSSLRLLLQAMREGDKQKIRERTTANGWNDLYKFHDDGTARDSVIYKTFQDLGATKNELLSPIHIWNVWAMWARKQGAHDIAHSVLWDGPADEQYVNNSKVYADLGDVIFALKKTPEGWKLNNVIHKPVIPSTWDKESETWTIIKPTPKPSSTHTSTKRNK